MAIRALSRAEEAAADIGYTYAGERRGFAFWDGYYARLDGFQPKKATSDYFEGYQAALRDGLPRPPEPPKRGRRE